MSTTLAFLSSAVVPAAAYPRPGRIERVSVSTGGEQANDRSTAVHPPAISGDGRVIAFATAASNLVPGDTNGVEDVFVHDRARGTTELVSIGRNGVAANDFSGAPSVSADGRYVAFYSLATNLVPKDTFAAADVFVRDLETGTTERVSVGAGGEQGNGSSFTPSISADGRYVAFMSQAANLVPGDTNLELDVFVRDRVAGTTERVSVTSEEAEANGFSRAPSISADGSSVAFGSRATNLVPGDTNGQPDVFIRDRNAGTTERVSVGADEAEADDASYVPSVSADGRYVAFYSRASNFVPYDERGSDDVFVRDREAGSTERVSVGIDGVEGNSFSFFPSISADGRYVAFYGEASNLVPGDTNETEDVFVHDREAGLTERASIGVSEVEANGRSFHPALSADGRHVVFFSGASNLVPGDTNDIWDVFVRDRGRPVDVGGLSAIRSGNDMAVSGWSTFTGRVVSAVEDPSGDAGDTETAGSDLTRASLIHRPQEEDVLVRLQLASLPKLGATTGAVGPNFAMGAGAPVVLYGLQFTLEGILYQVRARAGALHFPQSAKHLALYRCDGECTEQARLPGAIGTTSTEVFVTVPLSLLGPSEGRTLTDIWAYTAIGAPDAGSVLPLDEVGLPDAVIAAEHVSLGVAPAGTPAGDVVFDGETQLSEGSFSGTIDVSSLPAGHHNIWARACLGDVCEADSRRVTLG